MAEQFENSYHTQLNGAIDSDDTTITVDAAPLTMTGEFRIRIDNELILVGAVSGLTYTGCTRGVEGTTAASHADNAQVNHVLTAGALLELFNEAGGAGLYVDNMALHADGDDFTTDAMTGWTLVGLTAPTDFTEITTEVYDDTCIDVVLSAQGDRLYKTIDSGDWTYYLTIHGITNSTPNPFDAAHGMMGLSVTNDAGTGTGMSLYGDGNAYMWSVVSHVYSSTGNAIFTGASWNTIVPASASGFPVVYRLAKVGTTITGGISFNGGLTWKTATRTDSTTFTRINIARLFSSGGTNPKLRLGRFNLVP